MEPLRAVPGLAEGVPGQDLPRDPEDHRGPVQEGGEGEDHQDQHGTRTRTAVPDRGRRHPAATGRQRDEAGEDSGVQHHGSDGDGTVCRN